MRICPYCVAAKGLRGSELVKGGERDMDDEEMWFSHLEDEHGIIVRRSGESEKQARERCLQKGIGGTACQCGDCKRKEAV